MYALYRYKAINRESTAVEGELAAESEESLIDKLREQGLTVIDVKKLETEIKDEILDKDLGFSLEMGISQKKLAFFARQLAITLNAGIPLARIFSTLYYQTSSKNLKRILHQIGRDIQLGESLSSAMAKHKDVFDNLFLSMVSLGEASGTLPQTMSKLASLMERDLAIKRKLRSATAYPIFIVVFSLILSYALIAMVMPGFIPIFNATGVDIAQDYPLTNLLIQGSKVATNPYLMGTLIVLLVGLLIALKLMGKNSRGRYIVDFIKFHFPFLSAIVRLGITTRFCRSFSVLTKSGVPLLKVLSLVSEGTENLVMSRAVEKVAMRIREGEQMSAAMKQTRIFPELVVQMVNIGEEAGTLLDMLERISEYYEEEMESAIDAMTTLLEPFMMVVVGFIVGTFVMGILLPILGIATRLNV